MREKRTSLSERGEQESEESTETRFQRKFGLISKKALSRRFTGGGHFHGSKGSRKFTMAAP
jgi:hypothetical protein